MKNSLIDFLLKKARGYVKTWPTSVAGGVLIVNALSGIVLCVLDPACGIEGISQEWDKVMQGVAGLGLLEARSIFARSEDVGS